MESFDKLKFESLMSTGVALHNQRKYEAALKYTLRAFNISPPNTLEEGRAARDSAANYDRLGQSFDASLYAYSAFDTHDILLNQSESPTRETYRERSASAFYVGSICLRQAVNNSHTFSHLTETALDFFNISRSDIKNAKSLGTGINKYVDQYEINSLRRSSIAETLYGSKMTGFKLGMLAVSYACMSESKRLDPRDDSISLINRFKAKTKAFIGGSAVVALSLLNIRKSDSLNQLSFKAASKIL